MKQTITAAFCVLLSGASALAACGESDEDKVRSTALLLAQTDPAACEKLSQTILRAFGKGQEALENCRQTAEKSKETARFEVKEVTVDGSRATAFVEGDGLKKLTFVKRGDDWKILTLGSGDSPTGGSPRELPKLKIAKGLGPRDTVEAYYQAIEDEDGGALCGFMSERYIIEALDYGRRNPRNACLRGVADNDWADDQEATEGAVVVAVRQSGTRAGVRLSDGARVRLTQDSGRWVIDDVRLAEPKPQKDDGDG